MGVRRDLVCPSDVTVNMVQSFITSGWTCYMLVKFGKDSTQVRMIKVPCHNKDPIWVGGLEFIHTSLQDVHSYTSISAGWNVNSCDENNRELKRQVEGSASQCDKLQVL